MKRAVFAILIACVLVLGVTTFAESKTILVKTYTNVLVNDTNNYQINSTGDIVTYSIAKDINGIITAIYTIHLLGKAGHRWSGRSVQDQ